MGKIINRMDVFGETFVTVQLTVDVSLNSLEDAFRSFGFNDFDAVHWLENGGIEKIAGLAEANMHQDVAFLAEIAYEDQALAEEFETDG